MNPFGPYAQPSARIWQPVVLYALLTLGAAAPLCAAPHGPAAGKTPAAKSDTVTPMQDDLQSTTAKDLQLNPDNEKKAAALADFIQGSMAEDNAELDAAMDDFRKVLAVDPAAKIRQDDDDETLTLLSAKVGFELARSGDPSSGIDLLKDTIKASPKDPMAYFFLSQLYEKSLNKYDVALKFAQQALDLDPNNFAFYEANYELEIELNQPKKADDLIERAIGSQSNDPQYWLQLSDLFVRARVKSSSTVAPDDLKKMNMLFQKTVSLAKDDPFVLAKVADFDKLTKQEAEAIPLYRKALELKGDSNDPVFIEAREQLALSLVDTNQRDEAIKVLEDLTRIDPLAHGSYEVLGDLYKYKQDYDHALASYQKVLLLSPGDPRGYMPVMEMLMRLKKFGQAVDLMSDARKKFPDLPSITYQLALALTAAKKNQEALTVFEEAESEAQNSDNEMLDAEFYYYYGTAAGQAGLIPKATELLQKAIKLDPDGKTLLSPGEVYNDLGYLWVDHDQKLDEGGELIQRALEMEPKNPAYLDSLGWYYFKKGDMDKALDQLLKAQQAIQPEDSEVDDHVAETYQKLGKLPEALNYWQKAIAVDPDNKDIAKKIEEAKQKVPASATPAPAAQH